MMEAPSTDGGLAERLERLGGSDPSCCVPEYAEAAAAVRSAPKFTRALARFKALADANRLLAMGLLRRRTELCACEIQAATGLSHATVSHHMRILEAAKLVRSRRDGKWVYYRLEGGPEVPLP